ncbi:MAG: hypothetical protein IJV12_07485, partial [Acidaminococcaceae bacterium]|nr:hypothetical protein [Acidaminococcaceae bacterium]
MSNFLSVDLAGDKKGDNFTFSLTTLKHPAANQLRPLPVFLLIDMLLAMYKLRFISFILCSPQDDYSVLFRKIKKFSFLRNRISASYIAAPVPTDT